MKILLCVIALCLLATVCFSQPNGMTGRSADNMQVCTGSCGLWWVSVDADGTNAATVVIYDGTDTTGTVKDRIYVPAGYYCVKKNYYGVTAKRGWYVTVSGTNGLVSAGYQN